MIVDGAHAVGNYPAAASSAVWDVYLFSAHKWLMSSEPCGVLLSRAPLAPIDTPYDCWQSEPPLSFGSARMMAAFQASLDVFRQVPMERLWNRSVDLRERLRDRLDKKVVFIGLDAGQMPTNMVAFRPVDGTKWSCDVQTLKAHFRKKHMYPLILDEIDPEVPWLRVAFPYFLDVAEVDALCKAIEDVIAPTRR